MAVRYDATNHVVTGVANTNSHEQTPFATEVQFEGRGMGTWTSH
jgi:hypothetical protein